MRRRLTRYDTHWSSSRIAMLCCPIQVSDAEDTMLPFHAVFSASQAPAMLMFLACSALSDLCESSQSNQCLPFLASIFAMISASSSCNSLSIFAPLLGSLPCFFAYICPMSVSFHARIYLYEFGSERCSPVMLGLPVRLSAPASGYPPPRAMTPLLGGWRLSVRLLGDR